MTESPTRRLKVFLCHSSGDKQVVRELYRQLTAEEWVEPWLDEMKLLPGQEWDIEIEKAVEEADIVLACLSTRSVDKEGYIQKELRFVLNIADKKPEGSLFVIPLRLDDCVVPRRLKHWQWVDYFPDSQKSFAYTRLLESFKVRARKLGISFDKPKVEPDPKPVEKTPAPIVVPQKQRREENPKTEEELQPKPVDSELRNPERETPSHTIVKKWALLNPKIRLFIVVISMLLLIPLGIVGGVNYITNNVLEFVTVTVTPEATQTSRPVVTNTTQPTKTNIPSPTKPPILPTPTLGIGSTLTGKDGMTLLYVPAGEFTMGSDSGESNQKPVHKVDLDAFSIDKTEVTNKMYSLCAEASVCKEPTNKSSYTRPSYYGNAEFDNYPVIYVDWDMAKSYCEWADRRLPTEAEWEKAARGIDERTYPWGNDVPNDNLLNYTNAVGDTSEVGIYPMGASPYGVLDMAGNVYEWVADWYSDSYYVISSKANPWGPDAGQFRVIRGGPWGVSNKYYVRTTYRSGKSEPTNTYFTIGFRCAMDAP